MTTKKAIELIRIDIEYYKKQSEIMETFKDKTIKKYDWKNSDPDSMRSMIGKTAQSMYEIMSSSCTNQIKYYENILVELDPKKKQRKM